MSKSLLFECDPIDQPAAADPVERQTWCAMRIRIGARFVSRAWDKSLESERTSLYLPAFPVAEWITRNWWSLLNELCPSERVPSCVVNPTYMSWTKRHCLRSADSALLLPALYLFHDGQSLCAEWQPDRQAAMPNMPGEFITGGTEQLDSHATEESLAQFVIDILSRVEGVDDDRVRQMTEQWRAIQGAGDEERGFCTLAGRMGLDPYDPDEMTDELARFFEDAILRPDDPLVRDLTEVAEPSRIRQQWSWATKVGTELGLGPNPMRVPLGLPSRALPPPEFGYQLARRVRAAANLGSEPLECVEEVAKSFLQREFRTEERNHLPGREILAIVGRSAAGDVVAAGPQRGHPHAQRFLVARNAFHAMVTTGESPRLITNAYSWDQKASRAFAAELLAPQQVLIERMAANAADPQTVLALSEEFQASTIMIERQLENAGIPVSCE